MDNAVALVETYLRINGHFTVTEFPVIERMKNGDYRTATDLDILAPQPTTAGVQPGDRLFLFTDGLLELKASEDSELGGAGLARLIESRADLPCEQAAREIFHQVKASQQQHPHDDVLALICEVRKTVST